MEANAASSWKERDRNVSVSKRHFALAAELQRRVDKAAEAVKGYMDRQAAGGLSNADQASLSAALVHATSAWSDVVTERNKERELGNQHAAMARRAEKLGTGLAREVFSGAALHSQ